jgi:glutamate 5-kinase
MAQQDIKAGISDGAAALLAAARRVTIKVGSSLLIDPTGTGVRKAWLASLGEDIAALRKAGKHVVVVSSGAVALGRVHLRLKRSARLDHKQAAAAAGQALLMQAWEEALAPHAIPTAQLLLTLDDTERRRRWLNARATLEVLLAQGALPVINENDSVATDELRYGDNDRLSARAAQMIKSDMLILLSDVDGLYTADPVRDPGARHLPFVEAVTDDIEGFASDASAQGVGTGGMRTKLAAARIASGFGCATVIASGREPHPVQRLGEGARATIVAAAGSPGNAYKQWIAGSLAPAGSIAIDDGAVRALHAGKSLLQHLQQRPVEPRRLVGVVSEGGVPEEEADDRRGDALADVAGLAGPAVGLALVAAVAGSAELLEELLLPAAVDHHAGVDEDADPDEADEDHAERQVHELGRPGVRALAAAAAAERGLQRAVRDDRVDHDLAGGDDPLPGALDAVLVTVADGCLDALPDAQRGEPPGHDVQRDLTDRAAGELVQRSPTGDIALAVAEGELERQPRDEQVDDPVAHQTDADAHVESVVPVHVPHPLSHIHHGRLVPRGAVP